MRLLLRKRRKSHGGSFGRGTESISGKIPLRVCKVLYSFSANPVTNGNLKKHDRIGMYKEMNRIIEKEKGRFLLLQGICFFLATDNWTLC